MKTLASLARIVLQPLIVGLLAALLVRATLLQAYSIPSASMSPTLEAGDHILVTPMIPLLGGPSPDRGDVVVFRNPAVSPGFFVKRVIATGGDYLEIRDGTIRVNGAILNEPYARAVRTEGRVAELIPSEHLFVMGDHRDDSIDSRAWGFLPESQIEGRARMIFWSAAAVGGSSASAQGISLDAPPDRRLRWERIFRPIR